MNKMVVMEQNTSSMQKTKMGYEFLERSFQQQHHYLYQNNAQVSYDLNKMKMR
jgi:hypothetical protein